MNIVQNVRLGFSLLHLTEAGLADDHIKGFGKTLNTGHWHGDMPGLTDNAVILATSQGCPRQIVRFSPKHYAFQAHLEFDSEAIDLLIAADGEDHLRKQNKELPFVQTPEQLRANDYSEMNKKLFAFLDSLTAIFDSGYYSIYIIEETYKKINLRKVEHVF